MGHGLGFFNWLSNIRDVNKLNKEAKARYLKQYKMSRSYVCSRKSYLSRLSFPRDNHFGNYVYRKNDLGEWQAEIIDWASGKYHGNYREKMALMDREYPIQYEEFCGMG